jgi:hypothetical protein
MNQIDVVEDTYENIVPYMYANIPVVVKTKFSKWLKLRTKLIELQNNPELCNENICTVEICTINEVEETITKINSYSKKRISMPLKDFFNDVINEKKENLYLKDWHVDKIKELSNCYSVPEAFRDDWLDWYWKKCRSSEDDYSFLYMGI